MTARIEGLRADLGAAKGMLAEARRYHDVLAERQFESKVETLTAYLEEAVEDAQPFATATIVFAGKPVLPGRGIDLLFVSRALDLFRCALARARDELCARSGIPFDGSGPRLIFHGAAPGTTAFVLEEECADTGRPGSVALALDELVRLLIRVTTGGPLESSGYGSPSPKVLAAAQAWLVHLNESGATARVRAGDQECLISAPGVTLALAKLDGMAGA